MCLVHNAESGEDDDAVEQVTVKFARTETDRSKALREKSFGYLQKKIAEEPWIHTGYYSEHTDESEVSSCSVVSSAM